MKGKNRSQNTKYRRKNTWRKLLILFLACFSMFIIWNLGSGILNRDVCFASQDADDEVKKIQEAYSNIKDIKAAFTQKSFLKDLKKTETYNGILYIKRPSKIKWEYTGGKPQQVIINNDKIIIFKKKEKQAFKSNFDKQTYGQAPVALLSGFGNIEEEFKTTSKNNKLILTPKNSMGSIISIEIEISEENFPIKSFTIIDTRSNKVEIKLDNIETNTDIKDSMFEFKLPEGTKIYEYNS